MIGSTESRPRLRVLYLEDSPDDAELVRETLSSAATQFEMSVASNRSEYEQLLAGGPYDLILADFAIPGFGAQGALELAKDTCPTTPFVCVSGTIGEEATVELLKMGADDCVLKDRLGRLPFAVQRAMDDRQRARALRESEQRVEEQALALSKAQHFAHVGSWTWDIKTDRLEWSDEMYRLFGIEKESFSGSLPDVIARAIHPGDREKVEQSNLSVMNEATPAPLEYRVVWPDGSVHIVWAQAGEMVLDEAGNATKLSGTVQDITERKQRDVYGQLARDVLQILNEPRGERDSLERVVASLKRGTEFDAVGIRLREGDDFPYVAEEGYSAEHLRTENSLIARDVSGEACRDEDGNVVLECACGLVVSGRGDPLLTPGGSFWTSDSLPLLDLTAEEDPRFNPRNLCALEGFASMALVPIREKGSIVGLIHFSDRRKGCFDAENVGVLEGIAAHIGEALTRKHAEERLARSLAAIIDVVSLLSETRDPYTAGHQRRVARLSVAIAREMGLPEGKIDEIGTAAIMHDVGKMSVPAEILSKPGALAPIEFELIKAHAEAGYLIISGAHLEGNIAEIVYQHHERCDGSGYPRGLSSDELLDGAKVLAVADVVEAMSSHRPYRVALGVEAALAEIEAGSGSRYDANVADACVELFREKGFAFSE